MFDDHDEPKAGLPRDPGQRALELAETFCVHAEIAAVFEGPRKMDAEVRSDFGPDRARQLQRSIATLAKARSAEHPVLPEGSVEEARSLLQWPDSKSLATSDYHVYRRPGEAMVARWLAGDQAETFYERLQAHFDAAIEGAREDERQAHGWKQDAGTAAYLKALDEIKLSMADRYLRKPIREHGFVVLSTLTADELNIAFLAEDVMGVSTAELVGPASAPPLDVEEPTDRDRAWFFKLFCLRGVIDGVERMCFFAYLQKTGDSLGDEW